MHRSAERILTTHTGSLPRPMELTRLYARRARGEAVDDSVLEEEGRRALRRVLPKQLDAGIDIGNNGEQQREGFFLYLRHRLSGLGGSWQRSPRGDIERYPIFKEALQSQLAGKEVVSNFTPPKAVGDIRYLDPALVEAECRDFRAALDEIERGFIEPFLTAPSPGIVASAVLNEHYASEEAYLAALAAALKVEYDAIVANGFLLQLDCPDLALERHVSYMDKPLGDFLEFVERVVAAINTALAGIPRERVRMHVCWGITRGRMTATYHLPRSGRCCGRLKWAASCFLSPIRGMRMRCAASKRCRPPRTRSSSPASSIASPISSSIPKWWPSASSARHRPSAIPNA